MRDLISQGVWAIPGLLLLVVAWVKFNSPPTNRSGTTFALFYSGLLFYYALLIGLWILVIVSLHGGGNGLDWLAGAFGTTNSQARDQIALFAPVVAALIVAVASHFPQVDKLDAGARSFCHMLASIPREADYLGMELARNAQFDSPNDRLRQLTGRRYRGKHRREGAEFHERRLDGGPIHASRVALLPFRSAGRRRDRS
jgi:hypothetical protein